MSDYVDRGNRAFEHESHTEQFLVVAKDKETEAKAIYRRRTEVNVAEIGNANFPDDRKCQFTVQSSNFIRDLYLDHVVVDSITESAGLENRHWQMESNCNECLHDDGERIVLDVIIREGRPLTPFLNIDIIRVIELLEKYGDIKRPGKAIG